MLTSIRVCLFVCLLGAFSACLSAQEEGKLDPNLEPLRPLLGKTFRGEFAGSTPERKIVDVQKWERALNGQAVRLFHSINDGAYGGETIFRWDSEKKKVVYYYFTTANFMTQGEMSFEDGKFVTLEKVAGVGTNITEVKGTSWLDEEGNFHVETEKKSGDQWQKDRKTKYVPAPDAQVKFK